MNEPLENLTWLTNRSLSQTKELFALCAGNFFKLLQLEAKIKEHGVTYCPSTTEEVNKVLSLN